MTFGWSIAAAISHSRLKRSRKAMSAAYAVAMSFSATGRPNVSWVARNTTPMPPRPATSSIR
jgi:hypothetical protein